MVRKYDYLVIGSGIAGMSFALKVAGRARVAVVCKTTLDEANTYFAQGGVASVTDLLADNFDKHIHDTMVAGDWLSDPEAVEMVVRGAPAQIREAPTTSTARAAIRSSASSTMPTTRARKYRKASWRGSGSIPTSTCSSVISP